MNKSSRSNNCNNSWICLISETVIVLQKVWFMRVFRRKEIPQLQEISTSVKLSDADIEMIVKRVELIVRVIIFWQRQRCAYRSYSLAVILRKRGVDIMINFGYINLAQEKKSRGHCWLTHNGALFYEPTSTSRDFPHHISGELSKDIQYWVGE